MWPCIVSVGICKCGFNGIAYLLPRYTTGERGDNNIVDVIYVIIVSQRTKIANWVCTYVTNLYISIVSDSDRADHTVYIFHSQGLI